MALVISVLSYVALDLVARLVFCSGSFVLSSAFAILATKSATMPSRWTILPSYARFFSSWFFVFSSYVSMACYISWCWMVLCWLTSVCLVISDCSSFVRWPTLSSSEFPACWTCLIVASTSYCHLASFVFVATRSVTNAPTSRKFVTSSCRKLCISCSWLLAVDYALYIPEHQFPRVANRSAIVAFPFWNVWTISVRRCPRRASVS